MIEVVVERASVNIEALDADLRAALGDVSAGLSTNGEQVRVHLTDAATPEQQSLAASIIEGHDPSQRSASQQAEAQRELYLAQVRRDYGATDLNLTSYDGQPSPIQTLAQKIAW